MTWVIVSETERDEDGTPLYWDNHLGWTTRELATVFTGGERDTFFLPLTGQWEQL
jgi:hypothetical protein